jgi:hypothetical protein
LKFEHTAEVFPNSMPQDSTFTVNPHKFSDSVTSNAILKEWAITCEALAQGRQVVLLRKGGLLDEDGAFTLEYDPFFLLPTWLHQEKGLVKPDHHELWDQTQKLPDESVKNAYLRHFAKVDKVWQLREDAELALKQVPHIWSQNYLDLRFTYNPDKPLLCAVVRVWQLETPLRYDLRAEDMGCRSWIETPEVIQSAARPVLDDSQFQKEFEKVAALLG